MLKPTRVNFKGIGELVVTFKTDILLSARDENKLVKSSSTDTVELCKDGDLFLGQMLKYESRGTSAVQIGGYIETTYSGTAPKVGHQKLVADKDGNVKSAAADADGVLAKVVRVNTEKKLIGFFI